MNWFTELSKKRSAWLTLAGTAFIFEAIALYFQYGMGLEPCIMCIYQRTAMLGIFFAGLVGGIAPHTFAGRLAGFSVWGVSSIWGYLIAKEHIEMQTTTDPFAFTCDFIPNFPVPLHEMLPSFFAATGSCGDIDWSFLGLTMPGWMEVIFVMYSLAFISVFCTSFLRNKV